MQKSLVITLAFFTPLVLTFPSSNFIIKAPNEGRRRVVVIGKEFEGRHACDSNSVCECWYDENDSWLDVDCSNRNLTEAPKFLTGLRVDELNLIGNALEGVPDMTRNGFEFVRNLDLMGNRIKSISEKMISSKLEILNLSYNRITRLNRKVLRKLDKVHTLMLLRFDHNPLIFDCKSMKSLKILQSIMVLGPEMVTCAGTNDEIEDMNLDELCLNATTILSPVSRRGD